MRDGSSWADDTFHRAAHSRGGQDFVLSGPELHLLQHLRSLEAGAHAVYLVKTGRGRDGLQSFRVKEHYIE